MTLSASLIQFARHYKSVKTNTALEPLMDWSFYFVKRNNNVFNSLYLISVFHSVRRHLSIICKQLLLILGVLLHYDDVSLQDLYFLDPQWLCDILANIVTIREISLAKSGKIYCSIFSHYYELNNSVFKVDIAGVFL